MLSNRSVDMQRVREIADKLYELCGVKVTPVDAPENCGDVVQDSKTGTTVFTVEHGGNVYAFSIDGADEAQRVTAGLVREIAVRLIGKRSANPVRDFLEGSGDSPDVRVGKADYYVFAVYCRENSAIIRDYLYAMSGRSDFVADMGGDITAFCKCIDGNDYQSAGEFAEVLKENITEEIEHNVKIGVGGTAHGVSELPTCYAYAKSALMSGAEYAPANDIYSYKDYALVKLLSELPNSAAEKFVRIALDRNFRQVLEDDDLMTAANAFMQHSLNISEASRSMFVHRNTLIYRLDKIENATGLNIRNFNDAVTFRIAYLIFKNL